MLVSNSSTISDIHIYSYAQEKGALTGIGINDKVQEEFVNIITPGGKSFLQSRMFLKSPPYLHLHNW